MSRVAPQPDRSVRLRAARGTLILGLLLLVPRLVLAWFARPVLDLVQIAAVLVFVGGLLVVAIAVFRFRALRTETVWPLGVAGLIGVIAAGVVVKLLPAGQSQIAYDGGLLAPPAAVLYQYGYLLLGAVSQLGLMLLVGAVGVAITHWRTRRAS